MFGSSLSSLGIGTSIKSGGVKLVVSRSTPSLLVKRCEHDYNHPYQNSYILYKPRLIAFIFYVCLFVVLLLCLFLLVFLLCILLSFVFYGQLSQTRK